MIKTLQSRGITQTATNILAGSLALIGVSLIIGLLAYFGFANWIFILRIWILCFPLPLGILVISAVFSLGKWIILNRSSIVSIATNGFVFALCFVLLFGTFKFLQWLNNKVMVAQLDQIEEVCRKGFDDPATLDKFQLGYSVIGSWDHVLVSEDKTHNAIWFDSCDTLSACGVVCIRDGIPLKDSIINYEYYELEYIRDGLYWWD